MVATGGRAVIERPDVAEIARPRAGEAAASVAEPLEGLGLGGRGQQWTTPLALVRPLVAFASEVLERAGVPAVVRDEFR